MPRHRHTTISKILLITIQLNWEFVYECFEMMRWNGSDCGPSRPCIHFLAWLDMKFIWKHVYFCFHTITILHIFCNDMSFTCETLVNLRWTNLYVRWQPLFILIKGLKCDSSISGFKHQIIIKTSDQNNKTKSKMPNAFWFLKSKQFSDSRLEIGILLCLYFT